MAKEAIMLAWIILIMNFLLVSCSPAQANHTAATILYTQQRYIEMYETLRSPATTIELGNLRGWSQFGVRKFLGVPYAQPPVGELRFEKPLPHPGWSGIRNATSPGPQCPQLPPAFRNNPSITSEDCLLLDIYVPIRKDTDPVMFPVLIYFHGGALIFGSKEFNDGSVLAKEGRIILVSANYRIGLLGFIASGDQRLPGNLGLYDQQMAIQWVKNNIANYEGDPNSITLLGQAIGGQTVIAQMLSPLNNVTLFQRAIVFSGSFRFNEPMARSLSDLRRTEATTFNHVLTSTGCNNASDSKACLKNQPTAILVQLTSQTGLPNLYNPTIDISFGDEFLPGNPNDVVGLVASMNQYKVMIGHSQQEGSSSVVFTTPAQDLAFIINSVLNFAGEENTSLKAKATLEHIYSNFVETDAEIKRQRELSSFFNDWLYFVPASLFASMLDQHNVPTYLFRFTGPIGENAFSRNAPFLRPDTTHVDSAVYIFGLPLILNFNQTDVTISRNLMSLLTNFVRSGDPNSGSNFTEIWSLYNSTARNTFQISETLSTEYGVYSRADDLFVNLLTALNAQDPCSNNLNATSAPYVETTSGSEKLSANFNMMVYIGAMAWFIQKRFQAGIAMDLN